MNRTLRGIAFAIAALVVCTGQALAWQVCGRVTCDGTGLPIEGVVVQVTATDNSFVHAAATDANGSYCIVLPDVPNSFVSTMLLYHGEQIVAPAGGSYQFSTTDADNQLTRDFTLSAPYCGQRSEGQCWMTAGGAKFYPVTNSYLGDSDKWNNFGGNVYPSCSPFPGDGGNWNHIANNVNLHFQGRDITVVRCGNVDGIPPGSTSPATGFNFIDFTGTGTLKGIKGNKADYGTVYFFAHCEDRNEPGSSGQRDGAGKDRYFLHVYSDPADPNGTTLLLVDIDHDPSTVDPVTITDGNIQLHDSSCDAAATRAGRAMGEGNETTSAPAVIEPALRSSWGRVKLLYR
jgi:hypothetical protein